MRTARNCRAVIALGASAQLRAVRVCYTATNCYKLLNLADLAATNAKSPYRGFSVCSIACSGSGSSRSKPTGHPPPAGHAPKWCANRYRERVHTITPGKSRMLGFNEHGMRIGETHQRAKLSDHEVDLLRELHEEYPRGHARHMGYRQLAVKFDISIGHCRDICLYRYRAQTIATTRKEKGKA